MNDRNGAPENSLTLCEVTKENWRDVVELKVTAEQADFVAEPSRYLCLCHYGGLWRPLAVRLGGKVMGFLMWAYDEDDGSCWLGGIIIDKAFQGKGYGRQAVGAAMKMLEERHGYRRFALSYQPANLGAKRTYAALGFRETREMEDDEIVARLNLDV